MAEANVPLYAFNRGLISPLALARADMDRMALSAEKQTNWMARSLGSMTLRPGTEFVGNTFGNSKALQIPFVYATDDIAVLELTDQLLRVWVDDELVTRPAVTTSVRNDSFATDVSYWTDNDDSGAVSNWQAGGYLALQGGTGASARRYQRLVLVANETTTLHTLRVTVQRGPVSFKVGTTQGDDDLFPLTTLDTGVHSLQFLPNGLEAFVELSSATRYTALVSSVEMEASGTMTLTTPWAEADLALVRERQSGSVVYFACDGYAQRYLKRSQYGGWSFCVYETSTGPFDVTNTSSITLTPSDIVGDITLTAGQPLFNSADIDSLFQLTSAGQLVTATFTAESQESEHVLVTGITSGRIVDVIRTGTFVGTITLQRSIDVPGSWIDVKTYTTAATDNYDDDLDNQVTYYRLIVKAGDWTSGTAEVSLDYPSGSIDGSVRITSLTSSTVASASVLTSLGGTGAVSEWRRGLWSARKGYPSCVDIFQGRLWWVGKGRYVGSETDLFDSFDASTEGDSAPVLRGIGFGPVDRVPWVTSSERLILGTQGAELSVKSSNDAEALTNLNVNVNRGSSQGSADVDAVSVDSTILFVQRSGTRVFTLDYAFEPNSYQSVELSLLAPEVGVPGITRMAVQRQPDTRVHCVRSDGKVAVCLFNRAENLNCWLLVETDGVIEDVVVLPGTIEDSVYYVVKRTINGATVRLREKWSREDQSAIWTTSHSSDSSFTTVEVDYEDDTVVTVRDTNGDKIENTTVSDGIVTLSAAATEVYITPSLCRLGDSHVIYSGTATSVLTGYDHLEGEDVVVWADGKYQGTFTVSGGLVTLSEEVEQAMGGLTYRARFKSTKLAYADTLGTALGMQKKVSRLGLIMAYTHRQAVKYGARFDSMYQPPYVHAPYDDQRIEVLRDIDQDTMSFPGEISADARLCIEANAPYPCTVLGAVLEMETYDV